MELYTELVEKSIANRGNIVGLQEIKVKKTNYERYISLFLFDEGIKSHFKKTNSMSNYTDKVGIGTIWIDFDNEGHLDDVKKFNSIYKDVYELIVDNTDSVKNYQYMVSNYSSRVDDVLSSLGAEFIEYLQTERQSYITFIPSEDSPRILYIYTQNEVNTFRVINIITNNEEIRNYETENYPYEDKYVNILADEVYTLNDNPLKYLIFQDSNFDHFGGWKIHFFMCFYCFSKWLFFPGLQTTARSRAFRAWII